MNLLQNCELIPFTKCLLKTRLVPKLKALPICTKVPKEVCTIKYVRGEKIKKEIVSLWCRNVVNDTLETDGTEIVDYIVDYEVDLETTTAFDTDKDDEDITLPNYEITTLPFYEPIPTTTGLPDYSPTTELPEYSPITTGLPDYNKDLTEENEINTDELPVYEKDNESKCIQK